MKRIMVSGCLGQIGTELVTRLRRGHASKAGEASECYSAG